MELTTRIDIPRSSDSIGHSQCVLLLGSCFADAIGERLQRDKFNVVTNPFGTLYNPASICAHLLRCLSEREYEATSPEVIQGDDGWHSWMHHSTFSADSRDELLGRMNRTLHTTADTLRTADWLLITFGTAYAYRLKESGLLVANCHKRPDALFQRQRLCAADIADMWVQALRLLHAVNPGLKVIFTVSPIRHRRDGLHQNQLSKSELLLAVDQILSATSSQLPAYYFPSYEILLDELRDYRFYADDLVHPAPLAADYIYERFTETFVTSDERALSARCRDIARAVRHRPFRPGSEDHRQFLSSTLRQIQQLTQQFPFIRMEAEIELCNTQLAK